MANTKIGVVGVVELNGKLNNIANVDLKQVLEKCAIKVRDDAKQKVPNRHGELEKSLDYVFEDEYTVAVGTNKAYAPYVEIGTGIWAGINTSGLYSQYAGTGRQTPWAWPATEEDVRDYGVENGKGGYLNARQDRNGQWWIWTQGQWGQPFLLPSLLENENWIKEKLKEEISKEVKK